MFEYEQETYGSKGRERIRAAAMAHTGKKGKILLPPTRRNKQHRITVTYAQIASGEVEVKW